MPSDAVSTALDAGDPRGALLALMAGLARTAEALPPGSPERLEIEAMLISAAKSAILKAAPPRQESRLAQLLASRPGGRTPGMH